MTSHNKLVTVWSGKVYHPPLPELGTAYNDEEVYQLTLWSWGDLVKLEVDELIDPYDLLLVEERRKAESHR